MKATTMVKANRKRRSLVMCILIANKTMFRNWSSIFVISFEAYPDLHSKVTCGNIGADVQTTIFRGNAMSYGCKEWLTVLTVRGGGPVLSSDLEQESSVNIKFLRDQWITGRRDVDTSICVVYLIYNQV